MLFYLQVLYYVSDPDHAQPRQPVSSAHNQFARISVNMTHPVRIKFLGLILGGAN
jgi:hypothetical protein